MLPSDLLLRRQTDFGLGRPRLGGKPPVLVIGIFAAGNPNTLVNRKDIPLSTAGPNTPGLWAIAAAESGLADGIYHYWFQVENTNPVDPAAALILCTDPFATTVDWLVLFPPLPSPVLHEGDLHPPAVLRPHFAPLSDISPGLQPT